MSAPYPPDGRRALLGLAEEVRRYGAKIALFGRNARLYLVYTVITGAALGVFRLVYNFYVLALGYDASFLGELLTLTSLVALIGAIPAAYLGDRLGRKFTLLLSGVATAGAVLGTVVWQGAWGLRAMSVVIGLGQCLGAVTLGPFLMENSGDEERTYLFSFASGLQMVAASVGNWMGGWLTAPLAAWRGVPSASAEAYAIALAVAGAMALVGAAPVALMRRRRRARPGELDLSPLQYARAHPRTLATLVGPMLVTSVGAGLFMPFINVFYRVAHGSSDSQIGTLLAVGSLAMAAGLLIAPPLADRFGKVEVVVATQALSIPFLVLLGFAPVFWLSGAAYLVRLALMNMSNPVYQSFVMEQVDENARATVASLVSMAWSFGWAFSPVVSGQLQESSGFGVVYGLVIVLYTVAVMLYWRFFLGSPRETVAAVFRRRGLRR